MSETEASATGVIVFGKDEAGKPHASRFEPNDAGLAEKAAGTMGMAVLRVESDEQLALAAKLPKGRIFASGRAFVPFVKPGLYERLAALGEGAGVHVPTYKGAASTADAATRNGTKKQAAGARRKSNPPKENVPLPESWADIKVGSIVLFSNGAMQGWWEGVVVAIKDETFTLRWLDWPKEPAFKVPRWHLALLPPIERTWP